MKLRLPLLAACGLLLATATAFAAPAPPSPDVAAAPASAIAADGALAVPAGPMTRLPDPQDQGSTQNGCATALSAVRVPGVTPTPSPLYLTCGSCSRSPCVGATYNSVCGFRGGQEGLCLSPLGTDCSDGTPQCQCWYGPLP